MPNLINTSQRYPGPRALGHEPIILPDVRESVLSKIDDGFILEDGVVNIRRTRDPALPVIKNPRR